MVERPPRLLVIIQQHYHENGVHKGTYYLSLGEEVRENFQRVTFELCHSKMAKKKGGLQGEVTLGRGNRGYRGMAVR